MAGEKILVVDDEEVIQQLLESFLVREGFQVVKAFNGREALALIRACQLDLVLLDILLPEKDGIEVCQELRRQSDIPVLFITSKDDPCDLALGFGAGGDDYIRKPFLPMEVIIRVKAHLRRYQQLRGATEEQEQQRWLKFPGLKIDLLDHTVEANGSTHNLTAKEFNLLTVLAKNPNRFFTSSQLIELAWNKPESVEHRSLMVHISNLRKKIEASPDNPKYIVSVRGYGYKFDVPDQG